MLCFVSSSNCLVDCPVTTRSRGCFVCLIVSGALRPLRYCAGFWLILLYPVPWHQLVDAVLGPAVDQAGEQVSEIDLRIDVVQFAGLDERRQAGPIFGSVVTAREQGILS